jgi:two-component system NtrC family sensor kinase
MASLGQLAAGIAHELNNPAGFIFSNMAALPEYLQQLRKILSSKRQGDSLAQTPKSDLTCASSDDERLLADLESIAADSYAGAARIKDIVQNLRLFSRLDEAEIKRVDLHEGIDSTIRLLSQYYSSPAISLRREYGAVPPIECYAGQLNQVWMNLLVNAAQAIGQVGEVRITTACDGGKAIVDISDTGTGIQPEHIDRIFDPFFTTKPVGEGTGLGLSISHGIVVRHGGKLTVDSTPGRGATFSVTLPIHIHGNAPSS